MNLSIKPTVSIGLPVYNSSEYITLLLDSLIHQSFTDFELIISDDVSIDSTFEICYDYSCKDERIKLIRQSKNIGMVNNQNYVLKKAIGKYFMWAAHDDYYHPDFIKDLVAILEINPNVVTAFCPIVFFSENIQEPIQILKLELMSNKTIVRLLLLCYNFNDAPFYGIHQREVVQKTQVPTWWGKNSVTPANTNYPVIFFLLSSGEYEISNKLPLFYKRKKEATYLLGPDASGMKPYWYLCQRKFNLFIEIIKSIFRANSSFSLVVALFIPLFLQIIKGLLIDIYYRIKCTILNRKM
jgi:glycosyltransferase involved in cell wall biosynthesis